MRRSISFSLWLILIFNISFCSGQGRQAAAGKDRYIDALVNEPQLVSYVEDGAADASVVWDYRNNGDWAADAPPEVKNIVGLGPKAIPLLIEHLDDTRLTSATFKGRPDFRTVRVPVGYVCLDILLNIVGRNEHIWIKDSYDDGLGANVDPDYYFRPDAYDRRGDEYVAREVVRVVKSTWQKAYQNGLIRFEFH